MKQTITLSSKKYTAIATRLPINILFAVASLFTTTNLFTAEEGKIPEISEEGKAPEMTENDNESTKLLNALYQEYHQRKSALEQSEKIKLALEATGLTPPSNYNSFLSSMEKRRIDLKITLNHLLIGACEKNNIPFIKIFLNEGAEVNADHIKKGTTALFSARSYKAVQLLLEAQADVNTRQVAGTNSDYHHYIGSTALHHACASDEYPLEIVEILCEHTPVGTMSLDNTGCTPAHYLCMATENRIQKTFLPKAATILWHSLHQTDELDDQSCTPRDHLLERAPHLVPGLDAIIRNIELAQKQLSLVSPRPFKLPMSLKEFDLYREQIEESQLHKLLPEKIGFPEVVEKIKIFAGRYTPYPTYPALAFRD